MSNPEALQSLQDAARRNLAFDVKARGVAVALLNPGPVDTDMMKGVQMPLQRPASGCARNIRVACSNTPGRTSSSAAVKRT